MKIDQHSIRRAEIVLLARRLEQNPRVQDAIRYVEATRLVEACDVVDEPVPIDPLDGAHGLVGARGKVHEKRLDEAAESRATDLELRLRGLVLGAGRC